VCVCVCVRVCVCVCVCVCMCLFAMINTSMISPVALGTQLALIVGAFMLLGSVLVFKAVWRPSKQVLSATQYFCSGILIAVVGQELLPDLEKAAEGASGTSAIVAGFLAGVFFMYGVEYLSSGDEALSDSTGTAHASGVTTMSSNPRAASYLGAANPNSQSQPPSWLGRQSSNSFKVLSHIEPPVATSFSFQRRRVPWGLALPIYVHSFMDGSLIGVLSVTSSRSALLLAAATTVEMWFLGITFGALVMHCGWIKWLLAGLPPLVLVSSGAVGALCAEFLRRAPTVEAGVTSFGIGALLFLACLELLKEARENMGEVTSLRQSGCLLIGFFSIVLLERLSLAEFDY